MRLVEDLGDFILRRLDRIALGSTRSRRGFEIVFGFDRLGTSA